MNNNLQVIENVSGTKIAEYGNRDVVRELVSRLMAFHPASKEVGQMGMMAAAQLAIFMGASPLPSLNEIHVWADNKGKTNISLGVNYWRRQASERGGVLWDREPEPMSESDYDRYGIDHKLQIGAICRGVRLADVRELRELDIPLKDIMKMRGVVGLGVCNRNEYSKSGRPLVWSAIKRAETDFYKQAFPYMPAVSRPGVGLQQSEDGTYNADSSRHWSMEGEWVTDDSPDIIEGMSVDEANDDLFGGETQPARIVDTDTGEIVEDEVTQVDPEPTITKPTKPFELKNWYAFVIKTLPHFDNKYHVDGAVKVLELALPTTREEGELLLDLLTLYARHRDDGLETAEAAAATLTGQQPLFED